MKKSESTPEQWAAYLEKARLWRIANAETVRERNRAYAAKPEAKKRRRLRDAEPDAVERRRAYHQTPEAKQRAKERHQQRAKQDPNYLKKRRDLCRLIRTGFDADLLDALIAHQGNRCAICGVSFDDKPMRADHCHVTNKPRGLLCHPCNIIEGMMVRTGMDPLELAHRLVSYLRCPPAIAVRPLALPSSKSDHN